MCPCPGSPSRPNALPSSSRRSNRAHLADSATGFIDLQVWQSDRDAGDVVMASRWSHRGASTASMKSADHKASHSRIDPGLKADITLCKLEHLYTYEVVAE